MVAQWENPTIWLSQERQANLGVFSAVCEHHRKPPVCVCVCGYVACAAACAQCGMCVSVCLVFGAHMSTHVAELSLYMHVCVLCATPEGLHVHFNIPPCVWSSLRPGLWTE